MIEYIEVNPLPQVCQECEEQQKRYFAADPEEQLRVWSERDLIVIAAAAKMPGIVGSYQGRTSSG